MLQHLATDIDRGEIHQEPKEVLFSRLIKQGKTPTKIKWHRLAGPVLIFLRLEAK